MPGAARNTILKESTSLERMRKIVINCDNVTVDYIFGRVSKLMILCGELICPAFDRLN